MTFNRTYRCNKSLTISKFSQLAARRAIQKPSSMQPPVGAGNNNAAAAGGRSRCMSQSAGSANLGLRPLGECA